MGECFITRRGGNASSSAEVMIKVNLPVGDINVKNWSADMSAKYLHAQYSTSLQYGSKVILPSENEIINNAICSYDIMTGECELISTEFGERPHDETIGVSGEWYVESGGFGVSPAIVRAINLRTKEIKELPPMREMRYYHSMISVGDEMCLCGGNQNFIEIYNIEDGTKREIAHDADLRFSFNFAFGREIGGCKSDGSICLLNIDDGSVRYITIPNVDFSYEPRFTLHKNKIIAYKSWTAGQKEIYIIDPISGSFEEMTLPIDLRGLMHSNGEVLLFFTRNNKLAMIDTDNLSGKVFKQVLAAPNYDFAVISYNAFIGWPGYIIDLDLYGIQNVSISKSNEINVNHLNYKDPVNFQSKKLKCKVSFPEKTEYRGIKYNQGQLIQLEEDDSIVKLTDSLYDEIETTYHVQGGVYT